MIKNFQILFKKQNGKQILLDTSSNSNVLLDQ